MGGCLIPELLDKANLIFTLTQLITLNSLGKEVWSRGGQVALQSRVGLEGTAVRG